MRGLVGVLAALALSLSATPALAQAHGHVIDVQIPAPSLQGNLLGTPTTMPGSVYLPPGYGSGHKHYPVLYLIHGYDDNHRTWIDYVHAPEALDRLIAAHRIPAVIVVMPDATNIYGGGFYRNSPVTGRWEDFIADDVIHFADTHYRTLAQPGGRGLIGWSMGGYGAIHIAMDRGSEFAAVYAISPCCLAPVEDLGSGNQALVGLLGLTQDDVQKAVDEHDEAVLAGIAFLTSFSPAPDQPLHVRFPFELSGRASVPVPGVYDAYAAEFPINRIPAARDTLIGLRAFGFDFGTGDQYAHIPTGARMFSERLSELRIPHRYEVYDGDHHDHVEARFEAVVLPFVAGALDAPR